jgi:hypothetical protein
MRFFGQKWLKNRMDIAPFIFKMLRCSAMDVTRCARK